MRTLIALLLMCSAAMAQPVGGFIQGPSVPLPPPADSLAAQLVSLPAGQWSSELVRAAGGCTPTHRCYDDAPQLHHSSGSATLNAYYGHNGFAADFGLSGDEMWSFGSGAFISDLETYIHTGGGHQDWLGSEIQTFDLKALTWRYTDDSATYDATGAPSTDNGCVGGWPSCSPFQQVIPSTTNVGIWPNKNGRFAYSSTHNYGNTVYLKGKNLVTVWSEPCYSGSSCGVNGGAYIVASTGQWENPPTHAGGGLDPTGTNGSAIWIQDAQLANGTTSGRLWKEGPRNAGGGTAYLYDPEAKVLENAGSAFSWGVSHGGDWTMIPDPVNTGLGSAGLRFRAALNFSVAITGTHLAEMTIKVKIDVEPADTSSYQQLVTVNAPPAAINGLGRLYYMGYDRPGSTQVVYWGLEDATHLHIFDLATLTWQPSITLTGSPPAGSTQGAVPTWNRFGYDVQHDVFFYFGECTGTCPDSPIGHGLFYVFKRPPGIT